MAKQLALRLVMTELTMALDVLIRVLEKLLAGTALMIRHRFLTSLVTLLVEMASLQAQRHVTTALLMVMAVTCCVQV